MLANLNKKIEIVANLTIILMASFLAVVIVKDHLLTRSANQPGSAGATSINGGLGPNSGGPRSPQPGTKVNVTGIDWAENEKTLVLALSNTDAPFPRPELRLQPHQTLTIPLNAKYDDIKHLVNVIGSGMPIEGVSKMEVEFHAALFDDDTRFEAGTMFRRNLDPTDPQKWIKIED